jgi:hypothetical protein
VADAARAHPIQVTDFSSSKRPTWVILLWAFAAYSALAVLVTFPLVLHLPSRLPKDLGDPLLTTAILWWNAHVMPLTERWWNGFGFYPATGMMAFSAHFLGAGLIASPVQWLGGNAVTAYNLTFLVSFPLCAVAAHALALTLTRRHSAGIVCGLVYGFNPFRVAHVEHLELLMAFGMPAALAALHLFADTRRTRWLIAFIAALTLQALTTSYYALFFTVFLGMWVLWFMRPSAWREAIAVVAAGEVSALIILPIVLGYARIHDAHNLTREFTEVLLFSGDLSSLVTASPLSALWWWTAPLNGGERQLFPGLTVTALAVAGVVLLRRARTADGNPLTIASNICWAVAGCFAVIAIGARVAGPWRLDWGWLIVSVAVPYKPLSLSAAFAIFAVALSPTMRTAFRQRSALAFYLVAAAVLFLCSLGPQPALLGEQILYEPPYAWLMRLPFFADTVRVPARFAMLGMLALAAAGALVVGRLTPLTHARVVLLAGVMAGILADGWISELPLPSVPQHTLTVPPGDTSTAVLELPLGDVWADTAALYRVTTHHIRAVNGYNGYEPSYYSALRRALADRDETILDALAASGPLLIAADNRADPDETWDSFLSNHPGVTRLKEHGGRMLFQLSARRPPTEESCAHDPLDVAAAFDMQGPVDSVVLTDQNPTTRWITAQPQRAGDTLTLDLGRVERLCGVVVSMGSAGVLYPGTLRVTTSFDGVSWKTNFLGKMGGPAYRAALRNPRDARISVPLRGMAARFVALRIEQPHPLYHWAVADVVVDRQPDAEALEPAKTSN